MTNFQSSKLQLTAGCRFGLSLSKRIEYLSLAASNARSEFPTAATRQETIELLTEAEDKLEVAQVQIEIQRSISQLDDDDDERKEEAMKRLDEQLFTISEVCISFDATTRS